MMRTWGKLRRSDSATAAAEMALVAPLLIVLMFGAAEVGNLFMDQHALDKQVHDGARFASRLELNSAYDCPDTVFAAADADDQIVNVTKNGAVSGDGNPRWDSSYWARQCGTDPSVSVAIRCVAKSDIDTDDSGYTGVYTSLAGTEIPVVTVSAAVRYRPVLAALGIQDTNICLRAQSEAAVQGL